MRLPYFNRLLRNDLGSFEAFAAEYESKADGAGEIYFSYYHMTEYFIDLMMILLFNDYIFSPDSCSWKGEETMLCAGGVGR